MANSITSLEAYQKLLVAEKKQSSKTKLCCSDPFTKINVLFTGEIITCCADWSRQTVLGNLDEQSLDEILHSKRSQLFREMVAAGRYKELQPCQDCSQAWNIMAYRHQTISTEQ